MIGPKTTAKRLVHHNLLIGDMWLAQEKEAIGCPSRS